VSIHPVELSSARLRLRELTKEDVDAVLAIYGSPVATQHLSFEPRTRPQVEETVDHAIHTAHSEPRTEYNLAVERRDSSDLIGFSRVALEPHRAGQIGFALRPDQWGRGLGLETIHLLLTFGFDHLGLHRIWGARSPINIASCGAMLRAGMAEERRIRDHVFVHGAWRDSITHAILEDDWRSHRPDDRAASHASRPLPSTSGDCS